MSQDPFYSSSLINTVVRELGNHKIVSIVKVKYEVVNHASVVADYDFGVERGQTESKYETYSHICSSAVA